MNLVNSRTNLRVDGPVSRAFLQIRLDVVDESHNFSENSLSQGSFLAPEVGRRPSQHGKPIVGYTLRELRRREYLREKGDGKWLARQTFLRLTSCIFDRKRRYY
jgi:hypothetical protein